jgi:hypothetical protein
VNPKTGLQLDVSFDANDIYQLQTSQAEGWSEEQFRKSQVELQSDIDALSGQIGFGKRVQKDLSVQEKQMRGKEQILMEKERQRKLETSELPGFE